MIFMLTFFPKGYEKAAPGTLPDPKDAEVMQTFIEGMQKAGILLDARGLYPPAKFAVRVTSSNQKPIVTDGPYTEAKEAVGGYWTIQVKSKQEAVEWASRIPLHDGDTIEVRQVIDMSDFMPEVQ